MNPSFTVTTHCSPVEQAQLCPICEKAFTKAHELNRHVNYCRRAQTKRKGRPKACLVCRTSKVKCNFDTPHCERCKTKGLDCEYEGKSTRQSHESKAVPVQHHGTHVEQPHSGLDVGICSAYQHDWDILPDTNIDLTDANLQFGFDEHMLNVDHVALDSFQDFIGSVVEWDSPQSGVTSSSSTFKLSTLSTAVSSLVSETSDQKLTTWGVTRPLARGVQTTPGSKHAANLIARTVAAFPQMMTRRHTFPPFIHPHWYEDSVPEILANCMSIAQLFVSRTPDTRGFLWKTIDAEEQRLLGMKSAMSSSELHQGVQALTIYIVMAIIDQDEMTASRGSRLMQSTQELKAQPQCLLGGRQIVAETETSNPSASWEEWVYAESRRRMGCLWFAILRVFALKTDTVGCPAMDEYLNLPLLSDKSLWEARTREEWEGERNLDGTSYPLPTFGDLLAAQRSPENPLYAKKLNKWEAGVDKLGMMMNIAVELTA